MRQNGESKLFFRGVLMSLLLTEGDEERIECKCACGARVHACRWLTRVTLMSTCPTEP